MVEEHCDSAANLPTVDDLTVREALVKLCESIRFHDERAMKIYEAEVSVLTHQGEILRLQETTQRQVESLAESMEKYSILVPELISTNAKLNQQIAELLTWLTKESSKARVAERSLVWKMMTAVLAAFSTLLALYVGTKGAVP